MHNYIKIAWRNISRHKIYTTINVLGLALGICACLVIYLITSYDFSFDRFHPEGDRIYRIVGEMQQPNGEKMFLNSPFSDLAAFQHDIPGFEAASGFHLMDAKVSIPQGEEPPTEYADNTQNGQNTTAIITGPEYFDIFTYHWLAGDAASLKEPFKVVISGKEARKYFGNLPWNEMIGKKIIYDDSLAVSVSGIVQDWDKNTDLGYREFISISTATHSFLKDAHRIHTEDWGSLEPHKSQAFVKLSKTVTVTQVNARFAEFITRHIKPGAPGSKIAMWLQPLTDMHFTSDFHRGDDGDNQFRKAYLPTLYVLMGVAVFILIIGSVNFINLSTAQSLQRAKEIGIRKILGSKRIGLVVQFLTETLLVCFFAACLSILLVRPVLYLFSTYIPDGVTFRLDAPTLAFILGVTFLTSLLAGFYPARLMSAYAPVESLKGGAARKGGEKWVLRKVLIVFQFFISLVFIIGTIIIGNQIRYMQDSDKGFRTDAIATLRRNWNDHSQGNALALKEAISRVPGVDQAILEAFEPMGFEHMGGTIIYKGPDKMQLGVSVQPGNEGMIPFYDMKLLAGRNLFHSDSLKEFVINETCSKKLGFANPAEAIGRSITWWDGKDYPVVGVVADFHENSYHEPMRPVVIGHMPEYEKTIALRLAMKARQVAYGKSVMAEVEKQWKKIYPHDPFEYHYLNESISWLYDQETKTATLMNTAMIITIFISCMGMFGLALFTAERRTKEIGIRKVLGASATEIAAMLSKDFLILVVLALVIATPVSFYFMTQWLQDFAYRIHIAWWVFAFAGLGAIMIAMLTVSFQAVRAAMANPVKSLRAE